MRSPLDYHRWGPGAVSSNSPFCEKGLNSANEAPKLCCHMDIDAEQLLHLPSCLRKKPDRSGAIQHYTRRCWKTCLHQSTSYLATDEDERLCDDLSVFDKCVFHLVGERSTEGKKSTRGNRGGEERASEGRCEANTVKKRAREDEQSWERHREKRRTLPDWKRSKSKNSLSKTWPNANLTLEDRVLSEP